MAADFVNRAGRDINVGTQISRPGSPVRVVVGGDLHEAVTDHRGELLGLIVELQRAVTAAQERSELTTEASAIAQYELKTAADEVDAAIGGDCRGLLASLKRLRKPLTGAVDLLAKVAAITAAVRGLL